MTEDPFCYDIKEARNHVQHAVSLCNVALASPSCKALSLKNNRILRSIRSQLKRNVSLLEKLLPIAVDASYYATPLICNEEERDLADDATKIDTTHDTVPPSSPQAG